LRLLTGNPAALTGFESEAGSLAPGAPANLVAVSSDGRLAASFVNGTLVSA
jgi:N-acetylglucosamine-6-phosphate deacetylase